MAALTAPFAHKLAGAETGDDGGFLLRDSQATKVLDRERAAGLGDTSNAVAVYRCQTGLPLSEHLPLLA